MATEGFNEQRIRQFEEAGAPVDVYGVGSGFLSNSTVDGTNTDFTADVVRVYIDGRWVPSPKRAELHRRTQRWSRLHSNTDWGFEGDG